MTANTPTLAADGVLLRALAPSDAQALFVALGDPVVQRYRRDDAHTDIEQTRTYIADTLRCSRAAWAITEDGEEALGRLALREPELRVGEFGIVIRKSAQGRGLGGRAVELASRYAFEILGYQRLRADVDTENAASIALFQKLGFVREAVLLGHRQTKLGRRDSVILVKTRVTG